MPISTLQKEDDIELWKKWKRNKNPQTAGALVNQLLPLVKNDVFRYSKNIPYPVMEAYAKDLILKACENYNPNSGVSLSTFVKSYMIKLNQINADARSTMTIPENRSTKYTVFKNSYETLAEKYNREPTITEISDHTKWSKAEVSRYLMELRGEFTEDRPFTMPHAAKSSKEEDMIDFIYHDLTPREKILFEHTTGYGGKPKLSNQQIMAKLNINQNQLSYEKKKLVDKIEKVLMK